MCCPTIRRYTVTILKKALNKFCDSTWNTETSSQGKSVAIVFNKPFCILILALTVFICIHRSLKGLVNIQQDFLESIYIQVRSATNSKFRMKQDIKKMQAGRVQQSRRILCFLCFFSPENDWMMCNFDLRVLVALFRHFGVLFSR